MAWGVFGPTSALTIPAGQVKSSSGATRPRGDHPGPASCNFLLVSAAAETAVKSSHFLSIDGTVPGVELCKANVVVIVELNDF